MDVNQTSTVSFLEFNKFVFDGHISVNLLADLQGDDPKKALAALFQAVDSDGSGTCSNLELHRALQDTSALLRGERGLVNEHPKVPDCERILHRAEVVDAA